MRPVEICHRDRKEDASDEGGALAGHPFLRGGGGGGWWRWRASALLATQPLIARDGGRGLEPAADAPRSSGVCPGSQGGCRTRPAELSAC